jgi:hypothetical protein
MRFRWPQDTVFRRIVLDVEQTCCGCCTGPLHVCCHRLHRIYTLQGPLELCCRLKHCADPTCPNRSTTLSPQAELTLTLPGWLVGWDVFCFIGHRRFARHWAVPQIKAELADSYRIHLSDDAVSLYLRRYQAMLAARQQDPDLLRLAYGDVSALWLSIDGLQPEKGHETLYAVRELSAGRLWFAQALLSSSASEVRRLLSRAREMAWALGKPVRLWISDKQDAFVKGIAREFPGVPHRYCSNHFLRELAKPTLQADSHAKVQMRKKVRGLREIERQVLQARQDVAAPEAAGQVVLDYCGCVRGILNDDSGGPLRPAGLRMAEALAEVRASLRRVLSLNKPGPAHGQLTRLAGYIDQGLTAVQEQHDQLHEQVGAITQVAKTLDAQAGGLAQRRKRYGELVQRYQSQGGEFCGRLAKVMRAWQPGLFVAVRGKGGTAAPWDNLELERWFRLPKGHERRLHGRRHAGVRIVQEGPALLLALDAHREHPEPFTAQELLPYRHAKEPTDQTEAIQRRKVMRKARSPKNGGSSSPSWSKGTATEFSVLSG